MLSHAVLPWESPTWGDIKPRCKPEARLHHSTKQDLLFPPRGWTLEAPRCLPSPDTETWVLLGLSQKNGKFPFGVASSSRVPISAGFTPALCFVHCCVLLIFSLSFHGRGFVCRADVGHTPAIGCLHSLDVGWGTSGWFWFFFITNMAFVSLCTPPAAVIAECLLYTL